MSQHDALVLGWLRGINRHDGAGGNDDDVQQPAGFTLVSRKPA